jgi:hypothetical protein
MARADVRELGTLVDVTSEARRAVAQAIVGDDDDRDDLAGLWVGAVLKQAAPDQIGGTVAGVLEHGDGVAPCLGRDDRADKADLADVVDQAAELPDPLTERFQLGEVGLPDAVSPCRRIDKRDALARASGQRSLFAPGGCSSARARSARRTVAWNASWPSASSSAQILRCPHAR